MTMHKGCHGFLAKDPERDNIKMEILNFEGESY